MAGRFSGAGGRLKIWHGVGGFTIKFIRSVGVGWPLRVPKFLLFRRSSQNEVGKKKDGRPGVYTITPQALEWKFEHGARRSPI